MELTNKREIRVTGFGGQGVILMGKILGTAAAVHHHRHATLIQSYGPETRGSACRVDLITADETIDYPYFTQAGILIALSQDGYVKYRGSLAKGGTLFYDEDLVELKPEDAALAADPAAPVRFAACPAMRFAEQLGNKMMTNMVMLGFAVGATEVISLEVLEKVVSEKVPKTTIEANLAALRKGYEYARQ